jgi:ABC-type glutathione transport system ATPase component
VVTHNPEIAELTDRTVTVRDGRIVSDTANAPVPHEPAEITTPTEAPTATAIPEDEPIKVKRPHRPAPAHHREGRSLDTLSGGHHS